VKLGTTGIHHITAIASDAQRNLDFYVQVLGLRMVKRTVNFDAPDTYHLYYGDEVGRPGTLLTFFPWAGLPRGRGGPGLAGSTAFAVPEGSLGWWTERLARMGVEHEQLATRHGEETLRLRDPDGLELELVATPEGAARAPWRGGDVPEERALRGFHRVGLRLGRIQPSASLLTEVMGFHVIEEGPERLRLGAPGGEPGAGVDLLGQPDRPYGRMGAGTVHHVAWRARDEREQLAWREQLIARGLEVTAVVDRCYFRSIYFREPGGVLFEIATDPPGMTVDESVERLGSELRLPPWLEGARPQIERALPALAVPDARAAR
jgi:glyoxalase family protein